MNNIITKGIFSKLDIELAWERICASVGSDVKDYFGINVFNSNISKHIGLIFDELHSNSYSPTKPFKYFEPKKCGTQRTKTVLNIKDAIIYQAIADKIGAKLYDRLAKHQNFVYGSVLNENVPSGVDILDEDEPDFYFFEYYVSLYNRFVEGVSKTLASGDVQYKLETDITGFFDCIPHSVLLLKLLDYGVDKSLLNLLSYCLNAWSGTRDRITLNVGIPQGPPASFLLANILLDEIDGIIIDHDLKYFRFMDDIRVYAPTEEKLLEILVIIDRNLKGYSLSINASKTEITMVDSGNNDKDLMLDASGISFDKTLVTEQNELIVQDQTQLKNALKKSKFSPQNSMIKLKLALLSSIESDLLSIYDENKGIGENGTLTNNKIVRRFLTLAQKWRSLASSLKGQSGYIPNFDLVKVWFFGVRHIYWKTNSMMWNLSLYNCLESYVEEYEYLLVKLGRFEWVKYQLLSIFYKVYPNNIQRHTDALDELNKENSPLVRLGYYSVLIESIKEDSNLFGIYSEALKKEKDEYVKEAILSAVHYKNLQVPINSLKEWFLK